MYDELMTALRTLPMDIYADEERINDLRKSLKEAKELLTKLENTVALSRDAKEWGSNEKERDLNKAQAIANEPNCRRLAANIVELENELLDEESILTKHKNLFYAFRSMAELHAAHLLSERSVAGNGNGIVLAENIGL